jgi:hypothetical protein
LAIERNFGGEAGRVKSISKIVYNKKRRKKVEIKKRKNKDLKS